MMKIAAAFALSCVATAAFAQAQDLGVISPNDQNIILKGSSPPRTEFEPPQIFRYERDRKRSETDDYVDPLLKKGADFSSMEIGAANRRIAELEDKVERMQERQEQIVEKLNQVITTMKGEAQ